MCCVGRPRRPGGSKMPKLLRLRPLERLRDERGTTLIELIVTTILLLLVAAAGMLLVMVAVRVQPKISDRDAAIQHGRVAQERFARELRQSYRVETATAAQVAFLTFVRRTQCGGLTAPAASAPAIACRVTYTCTGGVCSRAETDPAASLAPRVEQLVEGITNSDVFGYAPSATSPGYVTMKLVFPASGTEDAVTLQDGVDLRNR